jgi:hypothetical protein
MFRGEVPGDHPGDFSLALRPRTGQALIFELIRIVGAKFVARLSSALFFSFLLYYDGAIEGLASVT